MGDMRAKSSDYALWPWPNMLDEGERIKVKLGVPDGTLVLIGTLEESPHAIEGERNKLRFKFDMAQPYDFYLETSKGDEITLSASLRVMQRASILPSVAMTGWFVADAEYENVWGLHFEDVQANREKSMVLSDAELANDTGTTEEPRL